MTFSLTFTDIRGEIATWRDEIASQPQPYIVFKAGGHKTQTKVLKGVEGVAEWRESYTLHEIPEMSPGILEIFVHNHKTLLPDDIIGSGSANISTWSSRELTGQGDVTVPLLDKKGRGAGTLHFRAKHSNFSIEAAQRAVGQMSGEHFSGASHPGGKVDGVGAGTTYAAAKEAAAKAAHEGRNVTVERPEGGIAAGMPVGNGVYAVSKEAGPSHTQEASLRRDAPYETGTPPPRTPKRVVSEAARSGEVLAKPPSGVKGVDVAPGDIIDKKYYTGRENRPQEQALVEQFREHHPYARRYETIVEHTGRERQIGSRIETLGTEEHIVDSKNDVNIPPHEAIKSAIPAEASDEQISGEGWVQGERGPICETKRFEITGDHVVNKKRVTNLREHRDFEKEFEIKTTFVEEYPLPDKHYVEQLSRERVLRSEKEKTPCEGHRPLEASA